MGISYAYNPFPILTAPATILLRQPTTEEEQRKLHDFFKILIHLFLVLLIVVVFHLLFALLGDHQKHKDLLQKQRDDLQEVYDATQQAIGRQREDDERQLREHIDHQNELHQQALDQQKQLIALQQQWQQEHIVTVPIVPVAPGTSIVRPIGPINSVGNNHDNSDASNNNNDHGTDANSSNDSDSVVVENPTLSKEQNSDEQTQSAEEQPNDDHSADNN